MDRFLRKVGMLCLLAFVACVAKAQDITATWDFQNKLPAAVGEVALQGNTGGVDSDVEGVKLYVDATNGKFNSKDRSGDVQVNQGTVIRVPVKSNRDIVVVTPSPNYGNFTIGGEAADLVNATEHKATVAEAEAGYVEVNVTGSCYLWKIAVTFVSNIQSKELYSTDFGDWTDRDATKGEVVAEEATTKYSREPLTFTVYNTLVGSDAATVAGSQWSKFSDYPITGGALQAQKNGGSYIVTSPLASVSKVTFVHGATGGNRGWSLWAKGDGDADWVQITTSVANPAGYCEVVAQVNRTNCQLKFTNLVDAQNAYMFSLSIEGNVDMSKYPALGKFSYNGVTYTAADIFDEIDENVQQTTIELFNDVELPSASNPLADLTFDNGQQDGDVTYAEQADGSVVATIKVTANGQTVTYNAVFVHKPYYTLTYYNTDGSVLEATQKVEKDRNIATLRNYDGVVVAEGKAMRGWFAEADGGEKYTVDYVVTSDVSLYAVATEIEEESTTKRYTFNLTDKYFYDEDHEAFSAEGDGTEWHDSSHGWVLKPETGKINLLVGGDAYIVLRLCNQGSARTLTLTDAAGNVVGTIEGKSVSDGESAAIEYEGPAGWLTLTATGADAYLHKIVVANVAEAPVTQNDEGYYIVNKNDGNNLLTVLDIANSVASADERTYIFVPDGKYDLGNEVLTPISGDNISIIGQSMDKTIIVNEAPEEGIGVSATFLITGNNTYLQDLTLQNAYDYYQPGFAGRAVVIQDKGNRTICKNVRMLSYQDTYYSNNNSAQLYFETSDIHGTVDFICGGGDVFFNNCTLTVEKRNADGSGECTLTAPTTTTEYGYVFSGCTVNCLAEKFNYGRAWQNNARCAYINTTLLQPERLNSNRWNTSGMSTAADKFVEYNTMDESGKVISPAEWELTFTHSSGNKTYNTILTDEEADAYTLDKVFTDWTPSVYATQKNMELLKVDGNRLTWNAVDGAKTYAVFYNDEFVCMTTATSYDVPDGSDIDVYTVRAANEYGGFGNYASTTTTAIDNVEAVSGNVVKTEYYNLSGSRVGNAYKGVVIKVDTMDDGSVVSSKVIK